MQERVDSANQRALTAETIKCSSQTIGGSGKIGFGRTKGQVRLSERQLQIYQKAEETRKKNAALPKQTAKRPKASIVSDLFGEDEYFIIGHNTRILIMDRRYSVVASPSSDAIFGNIGCTLTVANVDSDAEEKFKFVEGKSGSCQWVKRK